MITKESKEQFEESSTECKKSMKVCCSITSVSENQIVFAKWNDGSFYTGIVKEIYPKSGTAFVNFTDGDSGFIQLENIVPNVVTSLQMLKSLIPYVKPNVNYLPVLVIDPNVTSYKRFGCCQPFFGSDGKVCVFSIDEDEDDTLTPNICKYFPLEMIRIRSFPIIPLPSHLRKKKFDLETIFQKYNVLENAKRKTDLINPNVFAYWPDDSRYYRGKIDEIDLSHFPKIYHVKYCDGDEGWLSKEFIVPDVNINLETLSYVNDNENEEEKNKEEELEGEDMSNDERIENTISYPIIVFCNGFYFRASLKKEKKSGQFLTYFIGNKEQGFDIPDYQLRIDVAELSIRRKAIQEDCEEEEENPSESQVKDDDDNVDDDDEYKVGEDVFVFWKPNNCYYRARVSQTNKENEIEVEFKDQTKKILSKSEISKTENSHIIFRISSPPSENSLRRNRQYLVLWKEDQWYEAILYDILEKEEEEQTKKYHFIYNDLDEGLVPFSSIHVFPTIQSRDEYNKETVPKSLLPSFSYPSNLKMKEITINSDIFYPFKISCYLEDPTQEIISECERLKTKFHERNRNDVFDICSTYDHNTLTRKKCCVLREFVHWKRLSSGQDENDNFFPNSFSQDLDFCQSKNLGDCWLLAFFPHLFKNKYVLDSLILNPHETYKYGFFTCCLRMDFDDDDNDSDCSKKGASGGRRRLLLKDLYIVIDDFIPFFKKNSNDLVFVKAEKSLFVVILEKLFSKIFGGYLNLCGGKKGVLKNRSTLVSKLIFGCEYYESIQWKHGIPPKGLKDRIVKLYHTDQEEEEEGEVVRIVVMNLFQGRNEMGIVSGHAYSLMDLFVFDEENICLLGIRNPTGEAWNGSWSRNDVIWNIYRRIKEKCFMKMKNGYFFMEFSDFVKYFGQIDVYSNRKLNQLM